MTDSLTLHRARSTTGVTTANSSTILIIEDDEDLRTLLTYNLEAEGHAVTCAPNGAEGCKYIAQKPPDLVILDWMMPGEISGLRVLELLRADRVTVKLPIIMLTARGEELDRVHGLQAGADDYVMKPFSVVELMVRVKGLLRRARPEPVRELFLKVGDIAMDLSTRRVTRNGQELALGPCEFGLLEVLMRRPGVVFTRSTLLGMVACWQKRTIQERTVDVHIGRLRGKLRSSRRHMTDPIRTVENEGYAFDERYEY